jgi:hypothetical protein
MPFRRCVDSLNRGPGHRHVRPSLGAAVFAALLPISACTLVEKTVDLPVRAITAVLPSGIETEPVDPVDLQEDMLRFADNFVMTTSRGAEMLQRDGHLIKREELLSIKVPLASDIYGLATGSNALANLVGLTVFASVARWRVQDYWLPKVYSVSAEPILQALEKREDEIWSIANRVLKPQMQTELRDAINRWRKTSGDPQGDLEAFASNSLVNDVTKSSRESKSSSLPSSVFALLDLDPLAGLDPATRELTETRLFAERALFIGQRMPQLIQWQMELLAMRSTSTPQAEQVINSTSTLATASDRLSKTAEGLPDLIRGEREKLLGALSSPPVKQALDSATQIGAASDRLSRTAAQLPDLLRGEREKLLDALKTEQSGLTDLSKSFGSTLEEGRKMADSTGTTLKTFDSLLTHMDQRPSDPNSPPFEIKDYVAAALEINRMSQRLTETLRAFQATISPANLDHVSAQLNRLTEATEQRSEAVVDYAFRKLLLLVALSCLLVLISALLYQWLGGRLKSARS